MPAFHSPPYPLDLDLESAALRPDDFPFMRVLYVIRTEISDGNSRGIELRYPVEEDRFHPFIRGFSIELRLFREVPGAWEAYLRRWRPSEDGSRPLITSADMARLRIRPSPGPRGERIWVHEVAFWRGNLTGYLLVKWSDPIDDRFLQERVEQILRRVGR